MPTINLVRAEIIDPQMSVIVPPTTINPGAMFDGQNPRAGYAASADRYLFAWSFKTSTADELWVSLPDNQLTELHAVRLSTHGVLPRVAAGQDDFLVAWKDTHMPSGIAAARVRLKCGSRSSSRPRGTDGDFVMLMTDRDAPGRPRERRAPHVRRAQYPSAATAPGPRRRQSCARYRLLGTTGRFSES